MIAKTDVRTKERQTPALGFVKELGRYWTDLLQQTVSVFMGEGVFIFESVL